jgi:hypothetical protein
MSEKQLKEFRESTARVRADLSFLDITVVIVRPLKVSSDTRLSKSVQGQYAPGPAP